MNRSRARRLGLYVLGTLLTAGSTLLAIPAVVAAQGSGPWANLLVGQSIGTLAAVVVGWGWSVTGPSLAAASSDDALWSTFLVSLIARGALLVPVVVALVVAVVFVAPGDRAVAIAAALVAAVGATDAAWVLIGRGRTGLLLLLTVVPRVIGTLVGAGLVLSGAALVLLPLVQLLGTAAAVVLSTAAVRRSMGRARSWSTSRLELADGLRQQGHGTATALLAAVYVALPIVAVARLAPGGLASLGLADRIMRYGVFALGSVFGLAQAWVPAAGAERLPQRARTAARAGVAIGAVGATIYLVAAPLVADVLSAGAVSVPFGVIAGYAVAAGAILTTQVVGPAALVGLGGVRQLSRTTLAGAVVGVVVIAGGTLLLGVTGTAIGFAASEVVVLVLQLRALRRLLADRRADRLLADNR